MIPPRSPSSPLPDIVDFMQSQNLLLARVILTLSFGLAPVSNACYLIQMRRMSVSPAFRLALMIGAMIGAIVGMLFPMFCFGLGAFRPGYDPDRKRVVEGKRVHVRVDPGGHPTIKKNKHSNKQLTH